jgi:hypothetical protein
MPDLNIEYAYVCKSLVDEFQVEAKGSKGDTYTVTYGKLYGSELQRQGCEYGWACTCKGFKFRGTCKHITGLQSALCFWNYEMDPGRQPEEDEHGTKRCPDCGRLTEVMRIGV